MSLSFFSDGYWFARSQLGKMRDLYDVYRHYPGFKRHLKEFRSEYHSCNPFTLVREYFLGRGDVESSVYGETPLRTMAALAKECELTHRDCVFDLGCGRAMGLFFLSYLTGCQGVGVDLIPLFIEKNKSIHKKISSQHSLEFFCKDYSALDLSRATCIYLYGTCLGKEKIEELVCLLRVLPKSTKIVTVSYPLTDYSSDFSVSKTWKGEFAWGSTQLYLNRPLV